MAVMHYNILYYFWKTRSSKILLGIICWILSLENISYRIKGNLYLMEYLVFHEILMKYMICYDFIWPFMLERGRKEGWKGGREKEATMC